ncbi:cytochrome P450 6B7-like [Copidosoma floridanum]|uniref:cytochrome P450 6B7-like n=1 Tax=Copidosoma floridanum TaxID=29053 RepID=UPI000C6F4625|nr:cytochrome P450 6B7-like [Copidosoma floridanum]
MEYGFFEVFVGLTVLIIALYYYLTSNFDFWKTRKVAGPKPIPLFGNFKDIILGRIHIALQVAQFYNEFKNEPMVGIFAKSSPMLILRDMDLIKDVLIKDFHVFCDRGTFSSKKDPLNQNLVNLEHERWRPLRNKLSPVFSSGKLKEMFYLMVDCADHFERYVEKIAEKPTITECRELTAKFTTQTIGVCVFGLDTNAIADENSEFRRFGRAVFESSFGNILRRILRDFAPFLFELLGSLKFNSRMGFFVKSMTETMTYRRKNEVRRNDFMDLLLELQDQPEQMGNMDVNDRFLIGQAVVFFATGFETSALTISNVFYEVALNQDIQEKLRQDIETQLEKNDRKLTYDCIKSMTYLDKVIKGPRTLIQYHNP